MSLPNESTHRELASALRAVGVRLSACRRQGVIAGTWSGTQFKADADMIADDHLRQSLPRIADIPIVSEEDDSSHSQSRPAEYWLIDPIDGTASFAHGFSGFVCQVAWMKENEPILGAVYAPALERLYAAERGKGATVNGRPIAVRPIDLEALTLVDNYPEPRGMAARVFQALRCSDYLESGSIGLKMCLVADGHADLFVKDVIVKDWDVAAPSLVLREAGGAFAQMSGLPFLFHGEFSKAGLIAASSDAFLPQIVVAACTCAGKEETRGNDDK